MIGQIARIITFDTINYVWTDTADTTSDVNPARFTLGAPTQSNTQYARQITYTDPDGSIQTGFLQFSVVISGTRGLPGPSLVTRYGRFSSRAAALAVGPPQTTTGLNASWYRSPDVFNVNTPYTHTSSQFISNVVAGAPNQVNLVISGNSGGAYVPGAKEVYTESITPGHTTAITNSEIQKYSFNNNVVSNQTLILNDQPNSFAGDTARTGQGFVALMSSGTAMLGITWGGRVYYSADGFNFTYQSTQNAPFLVQGNNSTYFLGAWYYIDTFKILQVSFDNGATFAPSAAAAVLGNYFVNVASNGTFLTALVHQPPQAGRPFLFYSLWATTRDNTTFAYYPGTTSLFSVGDGPSFVVPSSGDGAMYLWTTQTQNYSKYKSLDGITWQILEKSPSDTSITFGPAVVTSNGTIVCIGSNQSQTFYGLVYSTNGGLNFNPIVSPAELTNWTLSTLWTILNFSVVKNPAGSQFGTEQIYVYGSTNTGVSVLYFTNNELSPAFVNWTTTIGSFGTYLTSIATVVNCTTSYGMSTFMPGSINTTTNYNLYTYKWNMYAGLGNSAAQFGSLRYLTDAPSSIYFSIPYFASASAITQSIFTGTVVSVGGNSNTSAGKLALNQDFVNKISALGTSVPIVFSIDNTNNIVFTFTFAGNVNAPTFTAQNYIVTPFSNAAFIAVSSTEGAAPTTLTYSNLFIASNRHQLQISAPPTQIATTGGQTAYRYPVSVITAAGLFTSDSTIILDFQTSLNGAVTEITGTDISSASVNLTGTNLYYNYPIAGTSSALNGVIFLSTNNPYFIGIQVYGTSTDFVEFTSTQSSSINGAYLATNGSTVVSVGNAGLIQTASFANVSPLSFAPQASGTNDNLNKVRWLNNLVYVAAGSNANIAISYDGYTWLSRYTGIGVGLNDCAYIPSTQLYVAVGAFGSIIYSSDLVRWNVVRPLTNSYLLGVTYCNATLGVVAYGNSGVVLSSLDGITWQLRNSGVTTAFIDGLFDGTNLILCGLGSAAIPCIVYTSNLTSFTSSNYRTANSLNAITKNATQYIIVGGGGEIVISTNGTAWAAPPSFVSLIPDNFPAQASALKTFTTGNYLFVQGLQGTSATGTVVFGSNRDSIGQAQDITNFFNTADVAYLASASGSVVTITSSFEQNYSDVVHSAFSQSTGSAVLADFNLVKIQDGNAPYTTKIGTPSSITFTKAANFGAGSTLVTLDNGQNTTAQTNPNPNSVTALLAISNGLAKLGYRSIALANNTLRVIDVDPTLGGTLSFVINNGVTPTGTVALTQTTIDPGVTEVVIGDIYRWSNPVNSGTQIN